MSHFNVPLIVWAKSQENVHKLPFLKKESRSGSNRDPSAYQPSGKAHKWGLGGVGASDLTSVFAPKWYRLTNRWSNFTSVFTDVVFLCRAI